MVEIPESLLRRSAEAKAKALGIPVEQVLAEMKGEAPPPAEEPTPAAEEEETAAEAAEPAPEEPAGEPAPEEPAGEVEQVAPAAETQEQPASEVEQVAPAAEAPEQPAAAATPPPAAEEPLPAAAGGARVAAAVAPRPVAPPAGMPEGVRTQRLLTVVKAKAIQQVKTEPTDKVNTWPHLMIAEFTALLLITAVLVVLSVILQAPLLEAANFNETPNPSKAPWYFLGLQELLSYFDPQIAGVLVPTFGLIGLMAIPYIDRNPSTRPSDRKLAILMFTFFLAGSTVLTMFGVLFRGPGFNFTYPWADGIWFDDLSDWVNFE